MAKIVERFEDMSPRGRLRLLKQDDGDILVCVLADPDGPDNGASVNVEFCTSGGKSYKTLAALNALIDAMAADNQDRPHCSRRGERGLGVDDAEDWRKGMHAGDILAGGY
jgi:hypothetical protein